jgi:GxxExxY protein
VDELASQVIDAAIQVHRDLGPAESVYENALCHELSLRSVPHRRQVVVPVRYKGLLVGEGRADVLVGDQLVVELKALPALAPVHSAQVLSYLHAMGLELGLLLNFGERYLKTPLSTRCSHPLILPLLLAPWRLGGHFLVVGSAACDQRSRQARGPRQRKPFENRPSRD